MEEEKFVCLYCLREFSSKLGLSRHERLCDLNPNRIKPVKSYKICDKCGEEISTFAFNRHYMICNGSGKIKVKENAYHLDHDDLICKFCGKECKNKRSLILHEIRCKENTNRIPNLGNKHSHTAWNKGLTKETDERVKKCGTTLSKNIKDGVVIPSFKNKHHTKDTKLKLSKSGGLRQGSGSGKKGWYNGYYCDSTYELVWIIYNLDHNIKFERFKGFYEYKHNGKIHKYYPDFLMPDNSLIEIKGYHTELVDIKASAVKDRKLTIMYKDDLLYAFDYVTLTYNTLDYKSLYNGIK